VALVPEAVKNYTGEYGGQYDNPDDQADICHHGYELLELSGRMAEGERCGVSDDDCCQHEHTLSLTSYAYTSVYARSAMKGVRNFTVFMHGKGI
jgi:hypothetical protein